MKAGVERTGDALVLDQSPQARHRAPTRRLRPRSCELTSASRAAIISWSSFAGGLRTASIRAGSCTGWPSPSQISAADWCNVSATCSVTARAGIGSVDQCSSPIMALLPATHSTRPTSLDSATAPDAAPVGG